MVDAWQNRGTSGSVDTLKQVQMRDLVEAVLNEYSATCSRQVTHTVLLDVNFRIPRPNELRREEGLFNYWRG
jgi:hypothetical protein